MKYLLIIASLFVSGFAYGQTVSVVAETGEFIGVPTAARIDAIEAGTKLPLIPSGKIIVGNSGGTGEAQTVTGDISLSNEGVAAIAAGVIVDADINANAAIAGSKLATAVQDSLALAGSAVQTEADPVASPVINALIDYLSDGLLVDGGLAISAESALKFKTTQTAIWTVGGVAKAKVAEDEIVFSAADTINIGTETNTFYGAWLVEVDSTGTVATKPAGGLTDQVYEASETAIDALPAATAGSVALGYILIELEATAGESFTANTDALTTIATFVDGDEKTLPAKIE